MELESLYLISFLKRTIPDISDGKLVNAFIQFTNEVKHDKWVLKVKSSDFNIDEHKGDGYFPPDPSRDKYILTIKVGNADLDVFLAEKYFYVRVTELDPMEIIPGIIIMVITMAGLILYSDKRQVAVELQKKYEVETFELNETIKKQETLAMMGRMAATLAHEFRTPISTISNLLQSLPSRASDPVFIERFVALSKREIRRSEQLINNLLIYGKDIVIAGEEWIDLNKLIMEVSAALKPTTITCVNAKIFGDRFYLTVLFENILKNSLTAGANKVSISIVPRPDGNTEIHCDDNGKGFSRDADIARLTEPFVTSRSKGGGLGLYLVKKIAIAHKASIELVAREKGAAVKLIFPTERVKIYG